MPYSDKLFRSTAIEWLIATDQVSALLPPQARSSLTWLKLNLYPIEALDHPKFKEMINVTSRATKGVTIPGKKAVRAEIIQAFNDHLADLKQRLNVRSSYTCYTECLYSPPRLESSRQRKDFSHLRRMVPYFAVTVHWVEELKDGSWQLKNALAGFVRMQQAHTGIRMGQVLFKVMQRIGIAEKVRQITPASTVKTC